MNLKPLLPGHVLVSPLRVVPRFSQLTPDEVTDLFLAAQRVSRVVERLYDASALNIAVQDGEDAGQSVPHVHAHIIPRKRSDLGEGQGDRIYDMMEGEEGDVGAQMRERRKERERDRERFPKPDNEERRPRSDEEMQREAEWLAGEMDKEV